MTLDNVYAEALGGGNVSYFFNRRAHVGVTGYAAHSRFLTEGMDLDFQEWSPRPFGGGVYGAVGVDAAVGRGPWDLFLEVAHSFDDQLDGGGGIGAIARSTITWDRQELELTTRYYDEDFANPYARPIAAPDEQDGNRARDEVGGRVRYTGRHGDLNLRAGLEVWNLITEQVTRTDNYVRLDYAATAPLGWGFWLEYEDKDLAEGGRGQCFAVENIIDVLTTETPLCKGQRLSTTGRLHANPSKQLRVTAQLTHRLVDDKLHPTGFRNDLSASVLARYRVNDRLRLRGRIRYLNEDLGDPTTLETSLTANADATFAVRRKDALRVRAELYQWLDKRDSTQARSPNPELWLWLEYQAKF